MSDLSAFFDPKAVAVIGASARETSVGHAVLKNLLGHGNQAKFPGTLYAVNPKGGEILGHPVHKSLSDIDGDVDVIVVCIPPKFIPGLIDEATGKGIGAGIIISAGFGEMGEPGLALQADMVARAKKGGMRLIGPNCLGVIRPGKQLNASFAAMSPPAGKIGLLSQSGALITGIISYAQAEQFGLSALASLGAKCDVDDDDVLRFLASDPDTASIAMYVEAFPDPRGFIETAQAIEKPMVALKGGATAAGAKAASSHTGSLAGSMAAYGAAFAQTGVMQAHSISDFMNWSRALAYQPPARGRRLAIITNAGGPGVLSADEAGRHGIELATLSDATMKALDEVLPAVWSRNNPVDVIGDATPERYRDAIRIVGQAEEVDGIVVIMTLQSMTDPAETARAIAEAHDDPSWDVPLLSSFLGMAGSDAGRVLDRAGIPEFNTPEQAVSAMGALMRRGEWLRRTVPKAASVPALPDPDLAGAAAIVKKAIADGQRNLDLSRARDALALAGLRYNRSANATTTDEAVAAAESIGFPIVLKIISPDVIHKTEVGAVALDLLSGDAVRAECEAMKDRVLSHIPGATITGYTVEEQVNGTEVIVGVSRDPQFGPMAMVGMGGIFVEVYKDVSFRLIPFDRRDAYEMIGEIQAQPLLDGARGKPVLNRDELVEVLMRVSALAEAVPEIEEIDLNPLVVTKSGLVAIDARVIAGAAPA